MAGIGDQGRLDSIKFRVMDAQQYLSQDLFEECGRYHDCCKVPTCGFWSHLDTWWKTLMIAGLTTHLTAVNAMARPDGGWIGRAEHIEFDVIR